MAGVKGRSGGHNRKSTAQLKAEGGYAVNRHRDRADETIKPTKLKRPTHFKKIGRDAWDRIVSALPEALLTSLDPDSLTMYCDLLENYHKLRPLFSADPLDKDTRIAFMATIDHLDKIGRQFGWSPQSRSGLKLPENKREDESAFGVLLSRMSGKN